jgi:branched-chain amino acid transport system permease protein
MTRAAGKGNALRRWLWLAAGLAAMLAVPLLPLGQYPFHLIVLMLVWAFAGTAWSLMGKFGLVSLGHGAFIGVGMYTVSLLWNTFGLTPWLGIPIALAAAVLVGFLIGYPSFRFQVVGHYFALVTLALGEVVRLSVIAARDFTGGSLGMTPKRVADTQVSWYALQFADKRYFYYIGLALWVVVLWLWVRIDRSKLRSALQAISEDEVAAASVGIHVTRAKLQVTLLSAGLTALGGILLGQYNMYISPEWAGIGISLQIVFASIVGGMYSLWGPSLGAVLTITLNESLRNIFGTKLVGASESIYGILLILFIIFMPNGIYGGLEAWWKKRRSGSPRSAPGGPARPTRAG